MTEKPIFIILGAGGFPNRISAAGNKYFFMSKALLYHDYDTLLINKYNVSCGVDNENGIIDGVEYNYLSGINKRVSFYSKIIGEIKASLKLVVFLRKVKLKLSYNYLTISYTPIINVILYWILCKVFRCKLVLSIMEYHPSMARGVFQRIRVFLFWRFSFYFADGILPISTYLKERCERRKKRVLVYKVPVLADYNHNSFKKTSSKEKYFLYCGSIGYFEVIDLLINSFNQLSSEDVFLRLILHGDPSKIEHVRTITKSNIKIYSDLSQHELYQYYSNAAGLLIPLRPTIQDQARFPQKIAEYLASSSPILTNPIGEINYYFKDGENAIFAKEYSSEAYCKAMKFVLDNPKLSIEIGENGYRMGFKNFHYESISKEFSEFLNSI